MKQRKRVRKKERQGRKQENNRGDRFTLLVFFLGRCELDFLVVLQADTTSCAHTISKGLVAQAY